MTAAEKHMAADSQTIGRVIVIYDKVYAVSADGMERLLTIGSPVFAYDRIVTEDDGRVSILINDADQSQIDLDKRSELLIDEDIFGGVSSEEIAGAVAEVEQVQETFLIEGVDLTIEPAAAATDSVASAGGEHPVADFDRVTHEGDVSSSAGQKVSEFFDHDNYTDLDHGTPGDPLDHLLDTDDDITS